MVGLYKQYSLLIHRIKQGLSARAEKVTVYNFRHCQLILEHLVILKYISSFHFDMKDNHFIVFLRYDHRNKPILRSFALCSTRSRSHCLRLPEMQRLLVNKILSPADYILTTKQGFLTLEQAFERRVGGILLFKIE
jgi:ribosomal protein S8